MNRLTQLQILGNPVTERQQSIVDAAREIIVTKGLEHLTVRAIAKKLGITDGGLYRHFRSKKEIISLLIDDIETTLLNTIDAAANKGMKPIIKLENIFWSHLSYAEKRKGVSYIIINGTLNPREKSLRNKMYDVVNKYTRRIKDIVEQGKQDGSFRNDIDTSAAGTAFFGMIQSIVTLWKLSGYRYNLTKNQLESSFDIYKKALLKQ